MKWLIKVMGAILVLCGVSSAIAAAHLGAPTRKSGWWEMTSMSGGRAVGKQNLCTNDASEAKYSLFDQITQEDVYGVPCSRRDFHRAGTGWVFDLACDTGIPADIGGGVVTNKGTIAGDFLTGFEVRSTVTQAGRTATGIIKGEYKGACPKGRVPGDLVIDGNTTLNVLQ